MPTLHLATWIAAPPAVCFDLARSVEAHQASTAASGERVVAGVMTGLLERGDVVTWEATHFGVRQRLTAKVTAFDRPRSFEDEMVQGAFASFRHRHEFREEAGGTLMLDTFTFVSPLGVLGRLADRLFLARYMRHFLEQRAAHLKSAAEAASRG